MQTITLGPSSGVTEEMCIAVRDADQMQALWNKHGALQLPPPKAPYVDFDDAMVVGVFLGPRPTAGYAVEIRGVDEVLPADGEGPPTLVVRAVESTPVEGAIVPQMTTSPFHLVRVERTEGTPVLELTK